MRTTRLVLKLKVATKLIHFQLEKSYQAGILNSTGISTQTLEVIQTTFEHAIVSRSYFKVKHIIYQLEALFTLIRMA